MTNGQRVEVASNDGAGNLSDFSFDGGKAMFMGRGTWGGGNIKLQVKMVDGNYADVNGSTLDADEAVFLELPRGEYRGVITTASAVFAYLASI